MDKMLEPTGLMLVGASFICLSIFIGVTIGAGPADLPDLQSKLKESTSLKLVLDEQMDHSHYVPKTLPSEQSISLSSNDPSEEISDLVAINSVARRDIVCNEEQNGDPNSKGLVNSLGVSVTGDRADMVESWSEEDLDWDEMAIDDVETIVDNAMNSSSIGAKDISGISAYKSMSAQAAQLGNNLKINVQGVSVTALNTAEGGHAEAISNIIIKPVQIIVCPSEVGEKLK